MVPSLRRRRVSGPPGLSPGRARRLCRSGNPGIAVARAVSRRIRGRDLAREYGLEATAEPLLGSFHLTTEPALELAQRVAAIGLACQTYGASGPASAASQTSCTTPRLSRRST